MRRRADARSRFNTLPDRPLSARSIPFGRPMLGETEKRLAAEVLEGTTLTHGPRCGEFEAKFA